MDVFLSAIREGEDFQIAHVVALFQVGFPGPGVTGVVDLATIEPEHGNHLVGIAAGHGEVDSVPELPHDGTLDITDLVTCHQVEILKH